MALPVALFQHWIHVREEDEGTVRVYRPAAAPLPPARGREGIEFRRSGEVILYRIAPADGTTALAGRWSGQGQILDLLFSADATANHRLALVACRPDRLGLRPLPGSPPAPPPSAGRSPRKW